MSQQALARKWRPKTFAEVVGQPITVQALTNALTHQHLHPAYLFTGTRGVGKTTLARLVAKCLQCEAGISATPCEQCSNCLEIAGGRSMDVIEVDAASRTKVEDTRDLLNNTQYAPVKARFKIYLIDEVHMLSNHSFNALLKTLEEPPAHVVFLLATTDPQKLPATILSRCLQFHLLPIAAEQIVAQLQKILNAEQIPFESAALLPLARAGQGSMRDALSLLDQAIAYSDKHVRLAAVETMLGLIDQQFIYQLLEAFLQKDTTRLLECSAQLQQQGICYQRVLQEWAALLQRIAVLQVVKVIPAELQLPTHYQSWLTRLSPEEIQRVYLLLLQGQTELPLAISERSGFEMILLRLLVSERAVPSPGGLPLSAAQTPPPERRSLVREIKSASTAPDLEKEWATLVKTLSLTGIAQVLAQQSVLQKREEDTWYLLLEAKQRPLLQKKYTERIEQALSAWAGKNIRVHFSATETALNTPSRLQQVRAQLQQEHAVQKVTKSEHVQKMMKDFDATLVKNSVVSKSNEFEN